jgi:hypothetical protein
MGLSSDPQARERQLDGLKRGRQTQARRLLGLAEDEPPAPAPAKPGPKPRRASSKRRTIDYDQRGGEKNGGRKQKPEPKPEREPEPKPEREPEREEGRGPTPKG